MNIYAGAKPTRVESNRDLQGAIGGDINKAHQRHVKNSDVLHGLRHD